MQQVVMWSAILFSVCPRDYRPAKQKGDIRWKMTCRPPQGAIDQKTRFQSEERDKKKKQNWMRVVGEAR